MEAPLVAPGAMLAGRYRLGELLGRGGMADVFDAVDLRLERPVAVKVMRAGGLSSEDLRGRFEAEAVIAARLQHPNVVAVYDTGDDDGLPFIVLERLTGETLAHRIARGPIPWPALRPIAADVLAALGTAHAAGILHRDIKPGNVLFDEQGTAKVADFGIARESDGVAGAPVSADPTTATALTGTPAYLSPERIEGEPATPRADLYALGVVMYEALSGRKPFDGDGPMPTAFAVLQHESPSLAEVAPGAPPAVGAAVDRAMAKMPDDRFADAGEMAAALGLAADAATLVAAPADDTVVLGMPAAAGATAPVATAGPAPGPDRARIRQRALLAMAAVAVVALVLVGMALAGRDPSPSPVADVTSTTVRRVVTPVRRTPVTTVTTLPPTTTVADEPVVSVDLGDDQGEDQARGDGPGKRGKGD